VLHGEDVILDFLWFVTGETLCLVELIAPTVNPAGPWKFHARMDGGADGRLAVYIARDGRKARPEGRERVGMAGFKLTPAGPWQALQASTLDGVGACARTERPAARRETTSPQEL